MSFFGKKILNLKTRPAKPNKGVRKALNYNISKSIGVLYTWSNTTKMEVIDALIKQLENDGKSIKALCFNPSKEEINPVHDHFGIKDLNSLGKIKSTFVEEFIEEEFDYLLLLDFELSEITSYIMTKAKSHYKVGVHIEEGTNPFDLSVSVNEGAGIENLVEQIEKYIKIIKHE